MHPRDKKNEQDDALERINKPKPIESLLTEKEHFWWWLKKNESQEFYDAMCLHSFGRELTIDQLITFYDTLKKIR